MQSERAVGEARQQQAAGAMAVARGHGRATPHEVMLAAQPPRQLVLPCLLRCRAALLALLALAVAVTASPPAGLRAVRTHPDARLGVLPGPHVHRTVGGDHRGREPAAHSTDEERRCRRRAVAHEGRDGAVVDAREAVHLHGSVVARGQHEPRVGRPVKARHAVRIPAEGAQARERRVLLHAWPRRAVQPHVAPARGGNV
mmetsp:Transcript_6406/g.25919  ORF Transcript_6406/g.25919 Transcript_6406/m.25919 type:complete len:200 (+) Transcript_6406:1825-2424(+)